MIFFSCPRCSESLSAIPALAGGNIICRSCGLYQVVPEDLTSPPPTPSSSPTSTAGASIPIVCPKCRIVASVPESFAGQTVRCKHCKTRFFVPIPDTSSTPPPSGPASPGPAVATPVEPPISYDCPHCGTTLNVDAALAGQDAICGACHGRTIVPDRRRATTGSGTARRPAKASVRGYSRQSIAIPILVSAISNIAVGIAWVATLVCFPLGIPMVILSIFEIRFYLDYENIGDSEFIDRAKTLGTLEIVVGVANPIALVCGILVLIHRDKTRRSTFPDLL